MISPNQVSTAVKGLECFCSLSLEGRHRQQKEAALGDKKPLLGQTLDDFVRVLVQSLAAWIWRVDRAKFEYQICGAKALSLTSVRYALNQRFSVRMTYMTSVTHLAQYLAQSSGS